MSHAPFCSSSGDTVYTKIGIFCEHTQNIQLLYIQYVYDEQAGAQDVYRLLIIINLKQIVHLVCPITPIYYDAWSKKH
jgi:hypothetical protein